MSAWQDFVVYGGYPRVALITTQESRIEELEEIYNAYLQKDIAGILQKDKKIAFTKLVILLSSQNGQLLNINELSNTLSLARSTIERFLFVLQETFIIKLVNPYFTNKRKEITKMPKIYFYDTGIRNAVIANFNPLNIRNDKGQLWENFLLIERLKKQSYTPIYANNFFWRTWSGKEVNFIEERDGKLFGYEFKWSSKNIKTPKLWLDTYPEASWEIIDKKNYMNFITD